MSLSDDERRVLDEMERQLAGPDVVGIRRTGSTPVSRVIAGLALLLAGIGVLLAGVVTRFPLIGVVGFGLMVAGTLLMMSRGGNAATTRPSTPAPRPRTKLEERWDRRIDGDI